MAAAAQPSFREPIWSDRFSKMAEHYGSPDGISSGSDSERNRSSVSTNDDVQSMTTVSRSSTRAYSFQATGTKDVYMSTRNKLRMLDEYTYTDEYFDNLNCDSYRIYVANERLIRMPQRGSFGDRALRAALTFGENMWDFAMAIENFFPDARAAAIAGLACCKALIDTIDHNSEALVPIFHALSELAALMWQITKIDDIFKHESSGQARYSTVELYSQLTRLVGDIAIYYTKTNDSMSHGVSAKFDSIFGDQVDNIGRLKDRIVDDVWKVKLGYKSDGLTLVRQRLKDNHMPAASLHAQITSRMRRAEGSWEWFESHLADFVHSPENFFTITGPVGSGKTALAHWISGRLQRPLDHQRYSTLEYTFPFDSPRNTTTLAFLKNTLSQLLEKNVGDVYLFEKIVSAFTEFDDSRDSGKLESSLWTALEAGLDTAAGRGQPLVLIIDGLEEVTDINPSSFCKTLRGHLGRQTTARAIILSGPDSNITEGNKHLDLTPDLLIDSIRAMLRQRLSTLKTFTSLSEYLRDRTVDDLAQKAKGSFLWASVASDLLAKQTSTEHLSRTIQSLGPGLDGVLQRLTAVLPVASEPTRRLFTFMLVSERPLATNELSELLRVDVKKREIGGTIDLAKQISQNYRGIVTVQDDRAHFMAKPVKDFMTNLMGKSLPSMEEGQRLMTSSLLLYSRVNLVDNYEPSFEIPESELVDKYFYAYPLLEYAATNWTQHFRSFAPSTHKDEISLSSEFKRIFPDSVLLALLEARCWDDLPTEALISRHLLALHIREACLQDRGLSTLQTIITLGNIYKNTPDTATAVEFIYNAARLSQRLLPKYSNVTVQCVLHFLHITEAMSFTERTELATWRIRMLEFMIEFSKPKYGPNSEAVLKWYQMLAELYVNINEVQNATATYKSIHEILVVLEGRNSQRTKAVAERFRGTEIVRRHGKKRDIQELETMLGQISDSTDTTDIDLRLNLASLYMSHKQWDRAEDNYIILWQRISEASRTKASYELRMNQLQVATEYVKLLRQLGRGEEAVAVLTCIWVEWEGQTFEDTAMTLRVKELGEQFKILGCSDVALTVFSKVWTWFKAKGKTTHKEAIKTTTLITEVAEEITTTTTTFDTTVVTTESTLAALRQVYDIHYSRSKDSEVNASLFRSFFSLVRAYLDAEDWAEAETVIKQTLGISWKGVLRGEGPIKLSQQFTDECTTAARYLGLCYERQEKLRDAEEIYLRIFRACLSSLNPDHGSIQDSFHNIVTFYTERLGRQDKVINVYQELLEKYRKDLGAAHGSTIELMYKLAAMCGSLNRKDQFRYYAEIVTALNQSIDYCHPDAQKAALKLVGHYYEEQSWDELQRICSALWESFVNHHDECHFEEADIEGLYSKYLQILTWHSKMDNSVMYRLSHEYYTKSSIVFGDSSAIVRKAMLAFAQVCENDETHYQESVSTYEELLGRIRTATSKTTTTKETELSYVTTKLSKVYFKLVKSTTTSTTMIDRGLTLFLDDHERLASRLGYWHESTLDKLQEITILYQKLDNEQSRRKLTELLQTSFMGIVTSSATSPQLFTAAVKLAGIYVSAGLVKQAKSLSFQVQHLIVVGDSFDATSITLKPHVTIGRETFAFLTAFDLHLPNAPARSYSEDMAARLLEISLYEHYSRAVAEEQDSSAATTGGIETILERGARLRSFWRGFKTSDYESLVRALDNRTFQLFRARYAEQLVGADDGAARELYVAIVAGLEGTQSKVGMSELVCKAGNEKVLALLEKGEFKRANQVARCVFHFSNRQGFYDNPNHAQYAIRLAEYMAGIDVRVPTDSKVRDMMSKTSKEITTIRLEFFRAEGNEFVSLKFSDISTIVRLLGAQQNYKDLEDILLELWHSREVRHWNSARVVSVGRLLVHAHYANNHFSAAVSMCDRIRYNLYRSKGRLDPASLAASELLASLLAKGDRSNPTVTRRPDQAAVVYEDVLREIDSACSHRDDTKSKKLALAATATRYFELLQRVGGVQTKDRRDVGELHGRLTSRLGLKVARPDSWPAERRSAELDEMYVAPQEWRLDDAPAREEEMQTSGIPTSNLLRVMAV